MSEISTTASNWKNFATYLHLGASPVSTICSSIVLKEPWQLEWHKICHSFGHRTAMATEYTYNKQQTDRKRQVELLCSIMLSWQFSTNNNYFELLKTPYTLRLCTSQAYRHTHTIQVDAININLFLRLFSLFFSCFVYAVDLVWHAGTKSAVQNVHGPPDSSTGPHLFGAHSTHGYISEIRNSRLVREITAK